MMSYTEVLEHRRSPESRRAKAQKIRSILADYLGDISTWNNKTALDIGCAHGWIGRELAPHFGTYLAMDVDSSLVASTRGTGIGAFVADGEHIPVADGSVNVAICAQVYEHTPHARLLIDEIYRVLAPGGVCFFSGPNQISLIEEHYRLPAIHWIPAPLAGSVLRATGRGKHFDDIIIKDYFTLRRWTHRFQRIDYFPALLSNPGAFAFDERIPGGGFIQRIPAGVIRALSPFTPNVNWLLVKPS